MCTFQTICCPKFKDLKSNNNGLYYFTVEFRDLKEGV